MRGSVVKRCPCGTTGVAGRPACKKAHGTWSYIVDAGRDPETGKRRQEKRGGFPTRDAAEAAVAATLKALSDGTYAHDDGQTVDTFLRSWLKDKVAAGLRPTTERTYRDHINQFLVPNLGHLRLRDVRHGHIAAMLREVGKNPRRGPTTIRRVHATLRSAFSSALRQQLIAYNPAVGVELPAAPRPKVQPWEPSELGRFLDSVAGDRLGPLFELASATGMRRGETCAVRWQDIDLDRARLVVRWQLGVLAGEHSCPFCSGAHRGVAFGPPKTRSGEARVVDFDDDTVTMLREHRARQDQEKDAWGDAYQDHGLVFAREDGTPLDPAGVSKRFRELVSAAGLRHVKVHGLRHGQASLMLASGADIALVSKRLGHSTIGVTSDVYSHLLEGVGKDAAQKAAALVPRSRRDQSVTSSSRSEDRRPKEQS